MTRKDYKAIANVIQGETINARLSPAIEIESEPIAQLGRIAEGLAQIMERDNERFDRSKFLEACGL
jgi:hypothetical protein